LIYEKIFRECLPDRELPIQHNYKLYTSTLNLNKNAYSELLKGIQQVNKKLFFLFFVILQTVMIGMPLNPKASKIDSLMNTYFKNGQFSGVVLVSEKGQIIFQKAFGIADREWNNPITIDTKFKIGSISKPVTALLILQLVQEGLIDLDGTIIDYLPDYNGKQGDRITIHHLLTHTSGILNSLEPGEEAVKERLSYDLKDLIKYAEEADLYFDPGSGFHYSNFGYNILAYIAEKVTGKTFAVLLNERIFDPLKMKDTRQYCDTQIEERLAKGYEYKLLRGFENTTYFDNSYAVGSGGLISTAYDLFLLHRVLFSDQLISEELKTKMFTPTKLGQYGYGWGISKKIYKNSNDTLNILEHSGSVNGFGSYMAQILNDTTLVIVLKNFREDTYISPAYAPDIGQQIIDILYGEDIILPKKSIARHIALNIDRDGFNKAKEEYNRIKRDESDHYSFEESELNKLGIELYFRFNMIDEALKVFEMNMNEFPRSYNTYDSYAFILMQKKDYASSIDYYKKGLKVLKLYPEENGGEQVQKDAEKASQYIKEMEEKINR
jgi:CubicO group peptidase (beta-lactamase class C family)